MTRQIASTPGDEHRKDPYGPGIVLVVGEGHLQQSFYMRVSTLEHYSGAFRTMTNDASEIHLPGDSVDTFSMVLGYMLNRRFFDCEVQPGSLIEFDQIVQIWDIGRRYTMPLIQNAAIDLFANKIKYCKALPGRQSVHYLWMIAPPGSTLRRLLVDLVREMWAPDGNRHEIWVQLVGGQSFAPDDLVWAMEELEKSTHDIRISQKTMTRLLACEWHTHEDKVFCEGSEEFKLLPEHLLED